jgi:hypothetical protein
VKTILLLLFSLAANAQNVGYIVAMYSAKETRGLGGYFNVIVDGRKVARLRYGTYYRLSVPPGAYSVTMDAPSKRVILCNVIAGESCYVQARQIGKGDGKDSTREVDLVSPEEAYRQLRNTIPLENEKIFIREWK